MMLWWLLGAVLVGGGVALAASGSSASTGVRPAPLRLRRYMLVTATFEVRRRGPLGEAYPSPTAIADCASQFVSQALGSVFAAAVQTMSLRDVEVTRTGGIPTSMRVVYSVNATITPDRDATSGLLVDQRVREMNIWIGRAAQSTPGVYGSLCGAARVEQIRIEHLSPSVSQREAGFAGVRR